MSWIDFAVLALYLAGIVVFGSWFAKSHKDVRDYFVSGGAIPWWAIMGSIVATETSTVTFISVPGYAYTTNFTFLQLVMGYMIGRLAVSVLFIPAYFRGEIITVYQLLGTRFGTPVKRLASSLFLATRTLADGFRLFATGLVLAALLRATPGLDAYSTYTILVASVLIMGIATIIYTYEGGMTAVIWTDVIQLVIYLIGAVLAALILIQRVPGGWTEISSSAAAAGRFKLWDFTFDVTRSYTFWSGIIGGAFLTTATHGTDQLMVQRYFCAKSPGDARKALLWSGVVVFAQFALFLLIGAMLWVYYSGYAPQETAEFMRDGRILGDRIFPTFIVHHLPHGAVGLVMAAIFAAAMSTLASSLNSSSAAAMTDFYIPATGHQRSDAHYLRVSRAFTAMWGVLQIVVAIVAIKLSSRVVDEVLGIASFTNGIILGVFLLGTLTRRVGQSAAFVGIVVGAIVMLYLKLFTAASWQWYVLVGSVATFVAGVLASYVVAGGESPHERT